MRLLLAIDKLVMDIGLFVSGCAVSTKEFIFFFWQVVRLVPYVFRNFHFTVEQMHVIGTESIILVSVTSIFTGGVGALTFLTQFGDFIPMRYVGAAVGSVVMVAVGPVLTGLVVAGRVGAAITAEIGTMVVTEQVDAMQCLDISPYRYLYAPRLVAGMVMVPVLSIFSTFVAIMGAFAILFFLTSMSSHIFFSGVRLFYSDWGLAMGLLKSLAFGIIISSIGCFLGHKSTHGAEGVGRATRSSVVVSDIAILISAYFIDYFLL